jgi:hypothetical protein
MRIVAGIAVALAASAALVAAQEGREVPSDSERITVPGCARGRSFIVGEPSEHEPIRARVEPGQRLRLAGEGELLDDIRLHERDMVEITGLVRKAALDGPGGISIAGGRIRIGGGLPRDPISGSPGRDPLANEIVIDVESWRPLEAECPDR